MEQELSSAEAMWEVALAEHQQEATELGGKVGTCNKAAEGAIEAMIAHR